MAPNYSWVAPGQIIGDWLSALAHQPQYLEARARVAAASRSVSTLGRLCSRITQGPNPRYTGHDYPCVITRNIAGDQLQMAGSNWVAQDEFERLRRFKLERGDVLVTLKGAGSTGKACLFDSDIVAIHSREVGVVRVADKALNSRFLSAYFQGRFGRLLFDQGTTGSTGQLTLSTTYLKALPVPLPDSRIQGYIGARVELAERCRARSRALRAEAIARFDELLQTRTFAPGGALTNVVDAPALTERLTSEFYLPRYFALDAHLAVLGVPIRPIRSLLRSNITRSSTPERDEAAPVPCILTSDIDPHEIRWRTPSLRITQAVHDRHTGQLTAQDVVYTSVGPPVGEAAVVLPQFLPMAVGGDVSILRTGEKLHPGFLALYLNSVFGQMQNDRYSRGIRQRRVYPEDIGAFLIPAFSAKDQAYVGERIVRHQALNELAVDLLNQAKADVEALIEGTLDVRAILAGTLKAPTAADIPELVENGA